MSSEDAFSAVQQADRNASCEFSVLTEVIDSIVSVMFQVFSSKIFSLYPSATDQESRSTVGRVGNFLQLKGSLAARSNGVVEGLVRERCVVFEGRDQHCVVW